MKLTWILEKSLFPVDIELDNLKREVLAQGHDVEVISWSPFNQLEDIALKYNDSCTVFHGSIETADRFHRNIASVPGAYFDSSAYFCSNYYPGIKSFILNRDSLWVPAGLLLPYFSTRGIPQDGLFFRSDSGKKYFNARVVFPDEFALFAQEVTHSCQDNQMVMFSRPKMVDAEYRILYVDGRAITGSRYHIRNELNISPDVPQEIYNFAEVVGEEAQKNCPFVIRDGVAFMDIGVIDGLKKVVEISAFSCAGLYACDIKKVVESVSKNALEVGRKEYEKDPIL
jgi:hypothetical protein